MKLRELNPGDRFTAVPTGTRWTLESHDSPDLSWARRDPTDVTPGLPERDRFHPSVLVTPGWST